MSAAEESKAGPKATQVAEVSRLATAKMGSKSRPDFTAKIIRKHCGIKSVWVHQEVAYGGGISYVTLYVTEHLPGRDSCAPVQHRGGRCSSEAAEDDQEGAVMVLRSKKAEIRARQEVADTRAVWCKPCLVPSLPWSGWLALPSLEASGKSLTLAPAQLGEETVLQ